MLTTGMYTSKRDDWETPIDFFQELDLEFHFDLDPCADDNNHKCSKYFTTNDDGLKQSWGGHRVFCNPPYGRVIGKWVQKAYTESRDHGALVVMLLPARTDTRWFHEYIYQKAEIRFVRGRLRFGNSTVNAPFPSMVVIYNDEDK